MLTVCSWTHKSHFEEELLLDSRDSYTPFVLSYSLTTSWPNCFCMGGRYSWMAICIEMLLWDFLANVPSQQADSVTQLYLCFCLFSRDQPLFAISCRSQIIAPWLRVITAWSEPPLILLGFESDLKMLGSNHSGGNWSSSVPDRSNLLLRVTLALGQDTK